MILSSDSPRAPPQTEHGKANLTCMIERWTRYTIPVPNLDRQSNALIRRIGRAWQQGFRKEPLTITFARCKRA